MKKLLLAVMLFMAASAVAGTKTLINVDKNGVGLQGYDPVAYFTQNRPVPGNPQFQSTYNGVKYYFVSQDDKNTFDSNPSKYEPQFGGYCAYAASQGHTAPIQVGAFQIIDGRLLLQYSESVRDKFNKDTQGNLKKADANWPGLVEKYGK
ncbi:MAG TPA: YHS domain-containing (seleno)protein [Terriglobales bacterium]